MFDIRAFLFDDDRGVSPVIGVILMVAITVILAAVIAAFVLGLGDTNESAPTVTWDYEYDESGGNLTVTNTGGDSFDPNNVEFQLDGSGDVDDTAFPVPATASASGNDGVNSIDIGNPSTAGDSVSLNLTSGSPTVNPDTSDFELRIIFTSSDGETSAEIGSTSGPDA